MRFGLLLASLLGFEGGPLGMDKALTTPDVPAKFLENVAFVGHFPLMASQTDPRISYALYVPKSHYNPDPSTNSTLGKLPLLVYVHATGRSIVAIYDELVPFADSTPCAILAPLFPAGIDGPNDVDSYKSLSSSSLRSDLGLLSVIDQVAYRWPGLETDKVFLMGFSGGGQFAQRFLYLYPERLSAISVGAPGIPTFLDESKDWPEGIADVKDVFNKTVDTNLIGGLPIQIIVGNKDTELDGDEEFQEWKKEKLGGDGLPAMNETRLESAQKLHDSLTQAGIQSQLDIVDGVGHNEKGVRETVLNFLKPWIQKAN
ncbi:alpha/beta-hydrolase [Hypoxylon trugodes]|uniref:alpha/beta-hydrolase n=1 Tax=Hypoxylon trugodes TaxID=326681 RepID=UPI0021A09DBF|nr:alpha/beta-hydrolase [Hypoxylon trugodes]KAI1382782.1 alpha/beta-hydrolase [Hypoxylon trugodes]